MSENLHPVEDLVANYGVGRKKAILYYQLDIAISVVDEHEGRVYDQLIEQHFRELNDELSYRDSQVLTERLVDVLLSDGIIYGFGDFYKFTGEGHRFEGYVEQAKQNFQDAQREDKRNRKNTRINIWLPILTGLLGLLPWLWDNFIKYWFK